MSNPNAMSRSGAASPSLPVLHLRLSFKAADDRAVGAIGGDVWRSAFGMHLRRRVCVTGAAQCEGCPLRSACVYPQVMETRAGSDAALLREDSDAPNPYVLSPRSGPAETQQILDLLLFGRGIAHAEVVVPALVAAAETGLGSRRTRLKLETVERVNASGRVVAWKPGMTPNSVDIPVPPVPETVTVHLESPLRLRIQQQDLRPAQFAVAPFLSALLRRTSLLTRCFGDAAQTPSAELARTLILSAEGLELHDPALRWTSRHRWSSRQQRSMPTGGIVGRFNLRGDLAPIWPWLWRGQWVHVGKGTVMGLGRYRLEVPRPPVTWLVSRHAGAVEYLNRLRQPFDHQVTHLDVDLVRNGDTVIGTLPVNLAAGVCARGARYLHLTLDLPAELRGRELDADQLTALGACLQEYQVMQPIAGDTSASTPHRAGRRQ